MSNAFAILLEFAGFSAPKRRPTARGRQSLPVQPRPAVANRARQAPRPEPVRRQPEVERRPQPRRLPATQSSAVTRNATSAKRSVKALPPRRRSKPVGGLKMGAIVALCMVCGTWLGSQVQSIAAAPSTAVASQDLAVIRPVSTSFTF